MCDLNGTQQIDKKSTTCTTHKHAHTTGHTSSLMDAWLQNLISFLLDRCGGFHKTNELWSEWVCIWYWKQETINRKLKTQAKYSKSFSLSQMINKKHCKWRHTHTHTHVVYATYKCFADSICLDISWHEQWHSWTRSKIKLIRLSPPCCAESTYYHCYSDVDLPECFGLE